MRVPELRGAKTRLWDEANRFILYVEAGESAPSNPTEWFAQHREPIRAALDQFGVVFFRGFGVDSHRFEAMIDTLAPESMSYSGGVTPRSSVHGTVYTATDAPPDLPIVQHHELSYHRQTPRYICFYCDVAPTSGGATPFCDGRRIGRTLAAAAPRMVDQLEQQGVLFVRNYNEANFKGWREAWNVSDRAELESLLREANVEWKWMTDEWLQTRQRLPAIVRDSASGARIVFSCIHLWHRSYVRKMNASIGVPLPDDPAKQPFATFFGDGSPIPDDFISLIHETFCAQMVAIPYQRNDVIVANNLLVTHGREPYTGSRKIYVTMREKVNMADSVFRQPMTKERRYD